MKPVAIWLSVLVLATLALAACSGVTTSGTPTQTPSPAPQVSDGQVERLSPELLEVELEDVDLAEALANIAEILIGLDPGLLDLDDLGLDEALIDVGVLLDAGANVDLGFDQVSLGQ